MCSMLRQVVDPVFFESCMSYVSQHVFFESCILQVVMEAGDVLWNRKDGDLILQLTRFLESGVVTLCENDPALGMARLPRVFHSLAPQVSFTRTTGQLL